MKGAASAVIRKRRGERQGFVLRFAQIDSRKRTRACALRPPLVSSRTSAVKYVSLLLLIILAIGLFGTQRSVKRSTSERERQFVIRTSAALWIVGIIAVAVLVFLSFRMVLLLLLPAFVLGMSLLRGWHHTRERLRREDSQRVDIERMKRIN